MSFFALSGNGKPLTNVCTYLFSRYDMLHQDHFVDNPMVNKTLSLSKNDTHSIESFLL
jgi:uncharacterized protein YpiB (UPF0302 family)